MSKFIHLKKCKCRSGKIPIDKSNPWWIAAPEYYNCFWTYLRHNNKPHTLSEVANLLKLSISAITSIEKKAFNKMRNKIKILNLQEKE
jgi:hypothetical protein